MEDTIKIRKDRIKNIAIIFLAVMLVLTFFSNSIMNFSLPEVATQYVESGTITEKVRGTGNITATDPYKLVISESRVIESVLVKKGDEVEKDQVLFKLEEKDSDELAKAEAELEALNLAYAQKILSGDISSATFNNVQNGADFSITQYQQRIQAANDKVTAAQVSVTSITNTVSSIEKQIALLDNKVVDTTSEKSALEAAKANHDKAIEAFSSAESTLDDLEAKKTQFEKTNALATAQEELAAAEAAFSTAAANYLEEATLATKDEYDRTLAERDAVQAKVDEIVNLPSEIDAANKALRQATDYEKKCLEAKNSAQSAYDNVRGASNASTKEELNSQLIEAKASLTKATADLEAAKTEQANVVKDVQAEVELGNQNSLIAEKREEVEKLREESIGSEIKAPVAGTIIELSKVAGETTVAEEALATIQVAGKGFSLSFSVTNEQAKKVKIGDVADLQNAWYYEDVKAILSKIQADTSDPGKKKLLVFSIEGSVTDGETLSLSIGQRSADYDYVVPNSAIREDKAGKFILIIEEKATPFGNRYKAKRVDVDVLASDDKYTAITADLDGYEYVITTSNKPVEAGKQVRLSDN